MGHIKVQGEPDFVKDELTGQLININTDNAKRVKSKRDMMIRERERLNALESDMRDIKAMLQQLLENNNNA